MILLSGSVRAGSLSAAIGRSILDLPLSDTATLLSEWHGAVIGLAERIGISGLALRVLLSSRSLPPSVPVADGRAVLSVERDPIEYRGTAGVLKDVCSSYDDDDYVLVANAGHVLFEPLPKLAEELASLRADVSLVSHANGTPGGLVLLRCGVLRAIPALGFVDLKEQALSRLAVDYRVRVLNCARATGVPVRTPADYIAALRRYSVGARGAMGGMSSDPRDECRASFGIVEDPKSVDPRAHVHDSVVLRGAKVHRDAVLVRSVVGRGTVIRRGEMVVDQLLPADALAKGNRGVAR